MMSVQASRTAKAAITSLVLAGFVQMASAVIAVDWKSSEGFMKNDGSPLLSGAGTPTALAQLIFSPDAIPDAVDLWAFHYTSGNDVWLADALVDASWSTYGEFQASVFTQAFTVGYLYVRVFDQGSMSGLTNNMWYYNSPFTNTIDNAGDPLFPNLFDISVMTAEVGDTLNVAPIPEPATWAFLFSGLVFLWGHKFRR